MSSLPLHSLTLPPSTLSSLTKAGYEFLDDIPTHTAKELTEAISTPLPPSLLSQASSSRPILRSAAATRSQSKRPTRFPPLDTILSGGLPKGHILQVSGSPGTPKEKIILGLVRSFLEAGEAVLFVDCQNTVHPEDLKAEFKEIPHYDTLISHTHIYTLVDLLLFFHNLAQWLLGRPEVKLLILSSLHFPFQDAVHVKLKPHQPQRYHTKKGKEKEGLNTFERNALYEQIRQTLAKCCAEHGLSVLTTNHLATRLINPDGSKGNFESGATGMLVPYLDPTHLPSGRTWRVLLGKKGVKEGFVRLLASPSLPPQRTMEKAGDGGRGPESSKEGNRAQVEAEWKL